MASQSVVDLQLLTSFAFYAAICLFKMMLMIPLTGFNRIRRKVFANPEDAKAFGGTQVNLSDNVVERVRRCHLNDMENIYAFVLLGFFYCFTGPSYLTAVWIFRIFTTSRIIHTYVYVTEAEQPRRFLAFLAGYICCGIMAYHIVATTYYL